MDIQHITDTHQSERLERLEARISSELKVRLQYAARLQGSSLSEFLLRSAEKAAHEVIREHKIMKFSAEDSHAFVKALFHPAKPNKKLQSAYLRYKKEVSSAP